MTRQPRGFWSDLECHNDCWVIPSYVEQCYLIYILFLCGSERTSVHIRSASITDSLKFIFPPRLVRPLFSRREILRRKRENEWVPVFVSRVETNEACVTRKVRHRKNPKGALDTRDAIGVAIYILGWRMHKFGPLTRENFQLMVPFSFFSTKGCEKNARVLNCEWKFLCQ